jgi:hypothetical protein
VKHENGLLFFALGGSKRIVGRSIASQIAFAAAEIVLMSLDI